MDAEAGAVVTFTGFASGFDNSTIEFHWDFGDGQVSVARGVNNSSVNHTYDSLGIYKPALSVTDSRGRFAAAKKGIVVYYHEEMQCNASAGEEGSYTFLVPEAAEMIVLKVICDSSCVLNDLDISVSDSKNTSVRHGNIVNASLSDGNFAKKLVAKNLTGTARGEWTARVHSRKDGSYRIEIAVYPIVYDIPPCCAGE
jgi:PKD repeat protein